MTLQSRTDVSAEVVHSLAKWKRYALDKYDFEAGAGLYTDMNAIRRDEDNRQHPFYFCRSVGLGKSHCRKDQRNLDTLKETVRHGIQSTAQDRKIHVYSV